MLEIVTEIETSASAAGIWSILTDFQSYPEWNPFIRKIEGEPAEGERLVVSIKPPDRRAMTFRPWILACLENRELRWRGRLLAPGILDGEHFFRIETGTPGATRFIHGETFSGILVPLLRRGLEGGTRSGFIAMNQALKSRAEHA